MLDRKKYEDYWYAFQEKLDEILAERKMSYRKLSIELGKSPGYIYDVVNRRIDPSFETLFEIAEYFGYTIWDFLDITHEAIVSQELWDKCREMEASVSQGKKTNTGYVHPLSGLVYCADCGNKMYMKYNNTRHSRKGPRIYYRENYSCGAYEKFGARACSSYYIQIKILNQIVLQDIRSKIDLVSIDENKARADFLKQRDSFAKKEETESRRKLRKDKARLEELGKLLSSVYEDKVMGRIPEEVCIELLKKYQDEKTELVTEIAALEAKLSKMERTTADVDEFIRRLKAYIDVPELTREMCMELIEFVTVDECPGKYSKAQREIHIYYKLIDKQPLPFRKCLEDSTCADN